MLLLLEEEDVLIWEEDDDDDDGCDKVWDPDRAERGSDPSPEDSPEESKSTANVGVMVVDFAKRTDFSSTLGSLDVFDPIDPVDPFDPIAPDDDSSLAFSSPLLLLDGKLKSSIAVLMPIE